MSKFFWQAASIEIEIVLKVGLEYSKDLMELQNDYPLAPNKIETKKEMLSN